MSKQAAQQYIGTVRLEENEKIQRVLAMMEQEKPELVLGMSAVIGSRENQQDSSYGQIEGSTAFAVVCDGMGGLNGGEKASQTAVKTLVEDFFQLGEKPCKISEMPQFFHSEVEKLDEAVYGLLDEAGNRLEAGTTMAAVYIEDGKLQWCSVGDSKIYLLRGTEILCVVREHNYRLILDDKLAKGLITRQAYAAEEHRAEALISFLGLGNAELMDINQEPFALQDGDVVLLCSDGLYKALTDDIIEGIIESSIPNLPLAARRLTEAVLERRIKGQDNTSVVLLQYHANK